MPTSILLLEDGFALLQEDGGRIVLSSTADVGATLAVAQSASSRSVVTQSVASSSTVTQTLASRAVVSA